MGNTSPRRADKRKKPGAGDRQEMNQREHQQRAEEEGRAKLIANLKLYDFQKGAHLCFTKRRRKAPEFIRGDISRRSLPTFLSVLIGLWRYDICRELAEVRVEFVEQQQNV